MPDGGYRAKCLTCLLDLNKMQTLLHLEFSGKVPILKTRDEDPDPVIFGPPDPVLFSTDPDPTCNNGVIKLFLS